MSEERDFTQLKDPAPDLFKDGNGDRLQIFLDARRIKHLKVIRGLLTTGGAELVLPATRAQIVLTIPDAGDESIESMDYSDNTVILDLEWARIAISRGKAPLESEDWGGFRIGGSSQTIHKHSPLPTPRQTPSESTGNGDRQQANAQLSNAIPSAPPAAPQLPFQNAGPAVPIPFQHPFPPPPGAVYPSLEQCWQLALAAQQPNVFVNTVVDLVRHQLTTGSLMPPAAMQNPSPVPVYNQATNLGNSMPSPVEAHIPPSLKRSISDDKAELKHKSDRRSSKRHRSEENDEGSDPSLPKSEFKAERRASSSKPRKAQPRQPGQIFVSESGKQIGLWLQLDFPNRQRYIEDIKLQKNGGRIVSEIKDAEYVILYPFSRGRNKGKEYTGWLSNCKHYDKPAVSSDFISACVESCSLMNAQDFLVEDEVSVVRNVHSDGRGRANYSVMRRDVIERREAAKQEDSPEESSTEEEPTTSKGKAKSYKQKSTYKEDKAVHKEKVVQKEEKSSPAKPAPSNLSPKKPSTTTSKFKPPTQASIRVVEAASKLDRRPTSRSPSPSRPPTQAVQWAIGRNKFTDEERAYMLRYVPKLLNRDPDAAYSALGVKMQQKMPQHPVSSWQAEVSKHQAQVEQMRKRILVQFRKAFDDIVNWFLKGKADTLRDEQVWPALASEYSYKTAPDWQKFWTDWGPQVNEAVEKRRQAQAAGN